MESKTAILGVIVLSVLSALGYSADIIQNISWLGNYQNFEEFKTDILADFLDLAQNLQLNIATLVLIIFILFILIYTSKKTGLFAFFEPHRRTKFWLIFRVVVTSPRLIYRFSKELHKLEHILINSKKQLKKCYKDDEELLSSLKENQKNLSNLEIQLEEAEKLGRKERSKARKEINKQLKGIRELINTKTNEIEKKHSEVIGASLGLILEQYQTIINQISSDVSVNVKIFSKEDRNLLKTIRRVPSDTESANTKLRKRVNTEEFILISGKTIEELKDENARNKASINSAYNFVCDENSPDFFYLCNNLDKAEKSGEFYSSSNEWGNYYNSLAVFLICDKAISHSENPKYNKATGILTFDSKQSYVFIHSFILQLGGYLTHRLYSFFAQEITQISSSRH